AESGRRAGGKSAQPVRIQQWPPPSRTPRRMPSTRSQAIWARLTLTGSVDQGRGKRTARINGEGQRDGQPGASLVSVRSLDSSAVDAYHSLDKRQAQAVAVRVSALYTALKDLREDLRLEARPIVLYHQQRGVILGPQRNGHRG